jgi:hypothetical protein
VGRDLNDHINFVGDLLARAYSIQVHVLASANCRVKWYYRKSRLF